MKKKRTEYVARKRTGSKRGLAAEYVQRKWQNKDHQRVWQQWSGRPSSRVRLPWLGKRQLDMCKGNKHKTQRVE